MESYIQFVPIFIQSVVISAYIFTVKTIIRTFVISKNQTII